MDPELALGGNFGPDSFGGKDFKKDGMRNSSVNEVNFLDSGLQGLDRGLNFRDHPARDDTRAGKIISLRGADGGDEACRIPGIAE